MKFINNTKLISMNNIEVSYFKRILFQKELIQQRNDGVWKGLFNGHLFSNKT